MKRDEIYLQHILECIMTIEEYTHEGQQVFYESKIIQDAVIRNLEVIGEAAKRISKQLTEQYSQMPWREMAGMRDVLIHDYFGVDIGIVWNVVENELPELKIFLIDILNR